MTNIPYIDSYWVIQDNFLAGPYPGALEEETARRKLRSLLNAGISCFFDLTRPDDSFFSYKSLLLEEAQDINIQAEWLNFPIDDFNVPTVAYMTEILDTIDRILSEGKSIYVHCIGGIGRTGTTVCCYLVRHGLSGDIALQQLEYLRHDAANWWHRSPESDVQREFVRNWPIGQ